MVTRKQIVECARTYIGSPATHQGRMKGVAIDCVGLPYCVAAELKLRSRDGLLIDRYEHANYSAQPGTDFAYTECQRLLVEKPLDMMQPGDVVVIKMPLLPCHVGIISTVHGDNGLIQAHAPLGRVVESRIDVTTLRRIHGCFMFPEVID